MATQTETTMTTKVTPIRTKPCKRCGAPSAQWLFGSPLCLYCEEFRGEVHDRIEARAIQLAEREQLAKIVETAREALEGS